MLILKFSSFSCKAEKEFFIEVSQTMFGYIMISGIEWNETGLNGAKISFHCLDIIELVKKVSFFLPPTKTPFPQI